MYNLKNNITNMNRIALFLPLVAFAGALLLGFDSHYWWAYALIAAAAEGILYLMFYLNNSSTEYLSGHIVRIVHEFPWVERKESTKSEKVGNKTRYTTTVSYVRHQDEYSYELNTGHTGSLKPQSYSRLLNNWRTGTSPITVNHHHCVEGGGGEESRWNGNENDTDTVTYTNRYRNPIKNSISSQRGHKIKKDEAKALGLFEYPKIIDNEQHVLLVDPDVYYTGNLEMAETELRRLNAFCGAEKQIHVFILLFPSKAGSDIAFKQRDYWKGFNKNELVVCLGVDGNEVDWCEMLSWMDDDTFTREAKEYFRHNHNSSITDFVKWLRSHLDLWKRKEVKELKKTAKMSLGSTLYLWISALVIAALVIQCAFWIGGK